MSDVDSGPDTEGAVDLMELSHKVDGIAEDLKNHKASTDRDTRDLWIFVVAMIVMGSFAVILNTLFPGTSEALTRDDDVDALLAPGVHCFDSHEEMAAARQRALAAIHRINWQIEHPAPASTAPNPYPMFHIQPYDPPAATAVPSRLAVVDATQPGLAKRDDRAVDASTCFGITTSIG